MATQYLILNGKQAAKAQNAQWWEKVLGRAKFPQDMTEFLFPIAPHPLYDTALVYVTDNEFNLVWPKMTPAERSTFLGNVKQESDPAVVQFKADIAAAQPPMPGA